MEQIALTLCLLGTQLVLCAFPVPTLVQSAQDLGWKWTVDSASCWDLTPPPEVFFEHWRFRIDADGATVLACQR